VKVLLIQQFAPREPRTPIALLDLAAYGRALGHEVEVAYADQPCGLGGYDLVGFSSLALGYHEMPALKKLRKSYPGRIVFGGKATDTLQGEDRAHLEQLGIEVMPGPGELLFQAAGPIDYDNYPAWQEADFRALDRGKLMTEAMSSRGCPYRCHFCHNTEKTMRFFAPERTAANASLILSTMGRRRVFLVDDVFAVRADKLFAVLEAADRQGLTLQRRTCFFVHISCINDETLGAIRAFDPVEVQVGIESGDDAMLEAMGKTFTSQRAEQQLRKLHSHDIKAACLFLMGFPGETKGSLQATIDFADRNRDYMSGRWVSYYQPVPLTRGWEMARERVGDNLVVGGWNAEINYVDPNLTIGDLRRARHAVMAC
jgi:radical SAM superfamily enzyme YgiQ (UPF0313 family)